MCHWLLFRMWQINKWCPKSQRKYWRNSTNISSELASSQDAVIVNRMGKIKIESGVMTLVFFLKYHLLIAVSENKSGKKNQFLVNVFQLEGEDNGLPQSLKLMKGMISAQDRKSPQITQEFIINQALSVIGPTSQIGSFVFPSASI